MWRTIVDGLTIEFTDHPPRRFIRCPVPLAVDSRDLMAAEISHLLEIKAIELVPSDQQGTGFYSILFLVPKSSGGVRGILNLKQLNQGVWYRRFKMHSLRSILASVRKGDFLQSVDLREAYLHVPVHPSHRRFLRFKYAGGHFQYCAMPFGLSSAPRTFTKLVAVVAATLSAIPLRVLCYLDDILVLSSSEARAAHDIHQVLSAFQEHGFTVNLEKSQLVPATSILHLGTVIDSVRGQVFLSAERAESIRELEDQVLLRRVVPLLTLS